MHCSIWTWKGDPEDLAARYEALVADVPADNMQFSACAKTADGIIMFDTCPSKEVFDAFSSSDGFLALLARHGLDSPESVVDHPIIAAYAGGSRVDS